GSAGAPVPVAAGAVVKAFFTWAFKSSLVTRPFTPVPGTCDKSTPISRAKRRTAGPANTATSLALVSCAVVLGKGAVLGVLFCPVDGVLAAASFGAGSSSAGGAAAGVAALSLNRVSNAWPEFTDCPSSAVNATTLPACSAGTSKEALSDSNTATKSST